MAATLPLSLWLSSAGANPAGWIKPGAAMDVDFVNNRAYTKTGGVVLPSSILTTTRASTGYAATSSGLLVPFLSNIPRITDLGLLVEQAATNLQLHSQTFSDVYWGAVRATGTDNVTTAPDGTATGASFTENNQNSDHFFRALTSKATSAITYTLSIYLKQNTRTAVRVFSGGTDETTNGCYADINLANGTILASGALGAGFTFISATIKAASSGWYRVTLTLTSDTANGIDTILALQNPVGTTSYQGNGTSGIYVWGAQLEASAFATSYIPTTTAAVTRATDAVALIGAALTIASQTTLSVYGKTLGLAASANNAVILGQNGADRAFLYADHVSGSTSLASYDGTNILTTANAAAFTSTTLPSKGATAITPSTRTLCLSGGTVASQTNLFAATTTVTVGNNGGLTRALNGYLQRLTIWSSALSNAQLQAFTT